MVQSSFSSLIFVGSHRLVARADDRVVEMMLGLVVMMMMMCCSGEVILNRSVGAALK